MLSVLKVSDYWFIMSVIFFVGNGYAVNITTDKDNFIRPNVTIEVNMN